MPRNRTPGTSDLEARIVVVGGVTLAFLAAWAALIPVIGGLLR